MVRMNRVQGLMGRFLLTLLILCTVLARPALAQPQDGLSARIAAVLDQDAFADAFWGVQILNLETGAVLFERNADKRFIPASNQKLITTAAALSLLGPDYRYTTRLFANGSIQDGTLDGDLVIRGAGDPTFGNPDDDPLRPFRQWADSLRALGITHITGHIIGDDDVFDDQPYGLGWAWDDLTYGYGAEISGLQFHEGTFDMAVRGTRPGRAARISWTPLFTDYVDVVNRSTTRARGTRVDEGYARDLSGNRFVITTEVPSGLEETERLAVHNPTLYTAHTLRLVLLRLGIQVDGPAQDVDELDRRLDYRLMQPVARTTSIDVAQIAEATNTRSQNLYAEHLLKTIGALRYEGEGRPGSLEAGVEALDAFLLSAGIDPDGIRIIDGSGLSFMNRVTPRQLVQILTSMHGHEDQAVREAFYRSLPIGGETGTLASRYRTGPGRGNVHAKTGYINGVRTLSGYVTNTSGQRLAFSLLCNGYSVPTRVVNAAQDQIVNLLAASSGR